MDTPAPIRRSPIVLIRTFVVIEFLGFVAYFLATTLGNYKYELYTRLPLFSSLLSYQTAKLLFLSGAQLVITIYAFFRWYYETYTIQPDAVTHRWGVFFKKEKSVMPKETMSVTLSLGPIGKILHYGSVKIESNGRGPSTDSAGSPQAGSGQAGSKFNSFMLADVSYPKKHYDEITRIIKHPFPTSHERPDISHLLKEEEHEQLEFKSSLRFDYASQNVNVNLERAAMKTIAAFLNSKGGRLVIGVDNARKPIGLEYDYRTFPRQNSDGFENHFTQVFNKMLGPEARHMVKLWFNAVGGRDICVVDVSPSMKPIYLKIDDNEHFYVRTGNVTTPLKLSEIESYAASHWPDKRES